MRLFAKSSAPALAALAAAALASGGCWLLPCDAPCREFFSTETFEVTPANGVWDDEYGRTDDPGNCSFRFRVARRKDGVAVHAVVKDDVVVADGCAPGEISCQAWNDDAIQCHFDGDNDLALDSHGEGDEVRFGGEYALAANGAAQSDFSCRPKSFGKDWTGTVNVIRNGPHSAELVFDLWFSWDCLGLAKAPDDDEDVTFGFNICYHDDDTGGRADHALYWKGNPSMPYRDESRFGTITLKGKRR